MDDIETGLAMEGRKNPIRLGNVVSVIIIVITFAIMTTNVQITSAIDLANIGVSFFLILFLSNLIYLVNFSNSAQKAKNGEIYIEAKSYYEERKTELIKLDWMEVLENFCEYYISKEIERAKKCHLAKACIRYDEYLNYAGSTKGSLKKHGLTKGKINAILAADKVKPIVLTPEMIYKFGGHTGQRNPLGMSPNTKSTIKRATKIATSVLTSLLTASIALDLVMQPTWQMLCMCLVKLVPVIGNWYIGVRDGTESVEGDLVKYIKTQADLISQAVNHVPNGQKVDKKTE